MVLHFFCVPVRARLCRTVPKLRKEMLQRVEQVVISGHAACVCQVVVAEVVVVVRAQVLLKPRQALCKILKVDDIRLKNPNKRWDIVYLNTSIL